MRVLFRSTLTIGAGITVHGGGSNGSTYWGSVIGYGDWVGGGSNASLINLGTIVADVAGTRPDNHTTELQSQSNSLCRTLLAMTHYGNWSTAAGAGSTV